jgi:ribose transport system permease protein
MNENVNAPERIGGGNLNEAYQRYKIFLPAVVVVIALIATAQTMFNGNFLTIDSASSMLMTTSLLIIPTIGQMTVILCGNSGIDLSVGPVMSMTALICTMITVNQQFNLYFSLVACILIGGAWGLVNGSLVKWLGFPALVLTLVVGYVISGLSYSLTKGTPTSVFPPELTHVNMVVVQPIRLLTLIAIVLVVVMQLVLSYSRFGRSMLLIGNNRNAAGISGISADRINLIAYIISGALAGFAGFLLAGYTGSARMNMATGYTMLSIAAAVVGGTKLLGGVANYVSGAIGALSLVLLITVLQAQNMPDGARTFFQGAVLVGVLLVNNRAQKLRQ